MNTPDAHLLAPRRPKPPLPPLPAVLQGPGSKSQCDPGTTKLGDMNCSSAELVTNFALSEDGCPLRGVGALQRGSAGPLAHSIFSASKARKLRAKDAVVGLVETPDPHIQIERSELCCECRRWAWRWAAGAISGKQCMLHLELSNSVKELVQQAISWRRGRGSSTSLPTPGKESPLLLVGCAISGATEDRLEQLRFDLERRSPNEMLLQAWEALEHEFGTAAGRLGADEINLALRRLSVSKGGSTFGKVPSDPSAFLRVQIWRELIRIHLGAVDDDVSCTSGISADEVLDDSDILRFVRDTENEFRESLSALSLQKLLRRAACLTSHAATMKQMQRTLRSALQEWMCFDPWKILGLSKTASIAEVRKAFFRRALQLHPDKGGGKAQFQELQRAYDEVLAELGAQRGSTLEEEESEEQDDGKDGARNESSDPNNDQQKDRHHRTEEKDQDKDESSNTSAGLGEERRVFMEGGSTRWLERLAAKIAAAAEAAGDQATGALRHCHAATEALERTPPDCIRASANVEAALRVVRKLSQASSLAADYLRQAGEALDARSDFMLRKLGSSNIAVDEIVQTVHDAFASMKIATDSCLCAVAQAVQALQSLEFSGPKASTSQARLHEALPALADACKKTAVSSIDAAETMAKTIQALESAARGDSSTERQEAEKPTKIESPDDKEEGESEQSDAHSGETKPEAEPAMEPGPEQGKNNKAEKQIDAEQEDGERQRALRELLEARQVMRRSNMDLLELQRSGWKLAESDDFALPDLSVECHSRTFDLLAEFLDEAARHFHEVLRGTPQGQADAKGKQNGETPGASRSCASWIMDALDQTFRFWLRSTPELAVTSDPRTSVLRAAVALDAAAVRCMLETQVAKRLDGVVALVLLESGRLPKRPASVTGNPCAEQDPLGVEGSAAVAAARKALSEALTRLERGPAAAGGG